jgi:hypothetical protein
VCYCNIIVKYIKYIIIFYIFIFLFYFRDLCLTNNNHCLYDETKGGCIQNPCNPEGTTVGAGIIITILLYLIFLLSYYSFILFYFIHLFIINDNIYF